MDRSTPALLEQPAAAAPAEEQQPKRSGRSSRRKAVPKLRDSCTGCAASKVRCTKEKPSCSRCARRGIPCEYIETRRTGRRSTRTQQPVDRTPPPLALRQPYLNDEGPFASSAPMPGSNASVLTPPSSGYTSPAQQQLQSCPDMIWQSVTTPPVSALGELPPAAYLSLGSGMDNVFDPSNAFPLTESPIAKSIEHFGSISHDHASAFGIADSFSLSHASSSQHGSISSISSPETAKFGDLERSQSCSSAASSNCCLDTAVGHLTRLLSSTSNVCRYSNGPIGLDQFPSVETTISENKRITEAVRSMLDCTCSQDDYILSIMALIILKVIARYSAAAQVRFSVENELTWNDGFMGSESEASSPSYAGSLFGVSSMAHNDHHHNHHHHHSSNNGTAAQIVLSELHQVREAVHLVSKRMKEKAARESSLSGAAGQFGSALEDNATRNLTGFPSATFDQLEKDLQIRLRDVSLEVIDILRRE